MMCAWKVCCIHIYIIFQLKGIGKSGLYRLYVEGRDIDAEMDELERKKAKKEVKKESKVIVPVPFKI